MNLQFPELEPEITSRQKTIQEVIDRLVDPKTGDLFAHDLKKLLLSYPDNERPLDNTALNLITLRGAVYHKQ